MSKQKTYDIAFRLGAQLNKNYATTFQKAEQLASKTVGKITGTIAAVGGAVLSAKTVFSAFNVFQDFEQNMANLAATLGIDQMHEHYEHLENLARNVARVTSKSAYEVADAMNYLALSGMKIEDIEVGIRPMVLFSEATRMDVGRAADLVTDTMAVLGIGVQGEFMGVNGMQGYLDTIINTQTLVASDANQLMNAYLGVGGTFKNMNVDIADSAALLGILATRGKKGSEAGTALNAILTNLTTTTGASGKAMEALGFSMFDTSGNYKPLIDGLLELQGILNELETDEQFANFAAALGGKEHLQTFNFLLDGLSNEYFDLRYAILDSDGALEKMAETMNNTMKAAFGRLKSAADELKIEAVSILDPHITPLIDHIANGVLSLSDKLSGFGEIIGGKIESYIPIILMWFRMLGTYINNNIMPVLNNFISFFVQKLPDIKTNVSKVFNWIKYLIAGAFINIKQIFISHEDTFTKIWSVIQDAASKLGIAIGMSILVAKPLLEWLFTTGFPLIANAIISVIGFAADLYKFISNNWSFFAPLFYTIAGALLLIKLGLAGIAFGKFLATTKAALLAWIALKKAALSKIALDIYLTLANIAANPIFIKVFGAIKGFVLNLIGFVKTGISFIGPMLTTAKGFIVKFISGIPALLSKFSTIFVAVVKKGLLFLGKAFIFLTGPIGLVIAAIMAIVAVAALVIKNWDKVLLFFANLWESIKNIFSNVADWFDTSVIQPVITFFSNMGESISEFMRNTIENIQAIWSKITSWFDTHIIQPIVGMFSNLVDSISSIGENISQAISDMFLKPIDWIKNGWSKMTGFFDGIIGKVSNIPIFNNNNKNIPAFAKGTNHTPSTFIAGEQGAELITNASGRKVFTALETANIFENISKLNLLQNNFSNEVIPSNFDNVVNIKNIPAFAKGTNHTPSTFIAGEQGAELITNASGMNKFSEFKSDKVFKIIDRFETLQSSILNKHFIKENSSNNFYNLQHIKEGYEKTFSHEANDNTTPWYVIQNDTKPNQTSTINFNMTYAPNIHTTPNANENTNTMQQTLKQDKKELEKAMKEFLDSYFERKDRLSNA